MKFPRPLALLLCLCLQPSLRLGADGLVRDRGAEGTAASSSASRSAASSPEVLEKVEAARVLTLMKSRGYTCSLEEDGSILWLLDDLKSRILFMQSGQNLQFYAAFRNNGKVSLEKINAWNRGHRYSRSYLDRVGDPCLELDLDLEGGITEARILDFLKTCKTSFSVWNRQVIESEE